MKVPTSAWQAAERNYLSSRDGKVEVLEHCLVGAGGVGEAHVSEL